MDIPGHVLISARALGQAVTAIAAEELRVPPKDVSVTLTDDHGLLAVAVAGPIRVGPLGESGALGIVQRCQRARTGIHARTTDVTGSQVRTVAIHLTGTRIVKESKVL